MARSRKNNPVNTENTPKSSMKELHNGKLRSKTKQLLKNYIDGKADDDDLEFIPDGTSEPSIIEGKQFYRFEFRDTFLDEEDEEAYKEELERYRKAFRK